MPKISIIIPTYNSEEFIQTAIESIVIQTYEEYEILIIDGNSSDKTVDSIKKMSQKHQQIRYISEKDKGIYDAMNKGIELAKGEWLYFLGSDDALNDKKVLQKVADTLNGFDVVYGNVIRSSTQKEYAGEFTYEKLNQKNICHQALFVHKSVFKTVGKFNLKYKVLADWIHNFAWFSTPKIKHKFIDLVIAKYNDEGFSSNTSDLAFKKDKFLLFLLGARRIFTKSRFLNLCKDEYYRAKSEKRYTRIITILFIYLHTYLFS